MGGGVVSRVCVVLGGEGGEGGLRSLLRCETPFGCDWSNVEDVKVEKRAVVVV